MRCFIRLISRAFAIFRAVGNVDKNVRIAKIKVCGDSRFYAEDS